jgi:hypothetical protein
LLALFVSPEVYWRRRYVRQAEVFFLSWLVSSPSALKQRQKTCDQSDCHRKQKSSQQWPTKHPDYFRGAYEQQKEIYGRRSEYKRRYRQQHPDYV